MSKNNDASRRGQQPPPIVSDTQQRLDELIEQRAAVRRAQFRTVGEPEAAESGEGDQS